jgi:hypothetical protein
MSDNIEKDPNDELAAKRKAFKNAIGMIESSGGKHLESKYSSAVGKYHFLWRYLKNEPILKGYNKRRFINDSAMQEKIMDMAIDGKLKTYAGYNRNAKKLQAEYNTNLNTYELSALTHFLGPGGVKGYLKDPVNYKPPGKNASVSEYLEMFHKYGGPNSANLTKNVNTPVKVNTNSLKKTRPETPTSPLQFKTNMYKRKEVDNTEVRQPLLRDLPMPNDGLKLQVKNENPAKKLAGLLSQNKESTENTNAEQGLSFHENLIQNNKMAYGGNSGNSEDSLIEFNEGGTHEQNPNGGVPIGMGSNGKMNTVEEGEVKFGDYVFSNRIEMNSFANGGDTDPLTEPLKEFVGPKKNKSSKASYPMTITKKVSKHHRNGNKMKVDDIRDQHIEFKSPLMGGEGEEVNWNKFSGTSGAKQLLNRYNDQWTRSNLKKQTGLSDYDIDNLLLRGLTADKQKPGGVSEGVKAIYDKDKHEIRTRNEFKDDDSVETHERLHASGIDALQGQRLVDILGNSFQQKDKKFLKDMHPEVARYLNKPHEAYGNFAEFREKLGLKPGQQITKEELTNLVKKKGFDRENFYRAFDDDKIAKALNTIAEVDNKKETEYRLS